jgi:hypothetical protein
MGQLKWRTADWRAFGEPGRGYLSTPAGYSAYPGGVFRRAAFYPARVLRVLAGQLGEVTPGSRCGPFIAGVSGAV